MTIQNKIGDTIEWGCTYKDSDGVAIDLTGYTIRSQARLVDQFDSVLFDLSIGNGITINSLVDGTFTIKIQDTTSYTKDFFNVDIEYTDSQSVIKSTDTFTLQMLQDITI